MCCYGYFGGVGMGSKLAFGCMRSVGCGLVRESVASWGIEGCGYLAECVSGHGRCTTLVLGPWSVVLLCIRGAQGTRRAKRFLCMVERR